MLLLFLQEHFSLFSESGSVKKMAEEYEIPFLGTIPLDPVIKFVVFVFTVCMFVVADT